MKEKKQAAKMDKKGSTAELWTTAEAALMAGVDQSTIRTWIKTKFIPDGAVKKVGKHYRLDVEAMSLWIKEQNLRPDASKEKKPIMETYKRRKFKKYGAGTDLRISESARMILYRRVFQIAIAIQGAQNKLLGKPLPDLLKRTTKYPESGDQHLIDALKGLSDIVDFIGGCEWTSDELEGAFNKRSEKSNLEIMRLEKNEARLQRRIVALKAELVALDAGVEIKKKPKKYPLTGERLEKYVAAVERKIKRLKLENDALEKKFAKNGNDSGQKIGLISDVLLGRGKRR